MFILDADQPPATLADLLTAIRSALQSWIDLPAQSNAVAGAGELPAADSLTIDVSSGKTELNKLPTIGTAKGSLEPGPSFKNFTILGHPVLVSSIPVQIDLTATDACFSYARNSNQKLMAVLQSARDGRLAVQILKPDLETALLALAKKYAGDKIDVQKVDVAITPISPTDVNLLLTITARKFMTAIIRVSGRIHIDEQMIATATNLKAASDGMVGTVAVGFIQPQLQKLEGKPLPLRALSLGNVTVRSVAIDPANGLKISAEFGSN